MWEFILHMEIIPSYPLECGHQVDICAFNNLLPALAHQTTNTSKKYFSEIKLIGYLKPYHLKILCELLPLYCSYHTDWCSLNFIHETKIQLFEIIYARNIERQPFYDCKFLIEPPPPPPPQSPKRKCLGTKNTLNIYYK